MSSLKGGYDKDRPVGKERNSSSGDHEPSTTSIQSMTSGPTFGTKLYNTRAMSDEMKYSNRYGNNMQLVPAGDAQDYELHLEELASSGSEYTSDDSEDTVGITGRTADVFGVSEPLTNRSKQDYTQDFEKDSDDDDYKALRQIAMMENEAEDFDIDSAEENDIMAEIRAEITDKVREEMKSELAVYQKAKENLEKPSTDNPADDLEGVEPKLKEAILKMRKLDKILAKKVKKEKQVKRERLMLQKRLKEDLLNINKDTSKKTTTDEKKNTEKFLMLALPPSHNAGISMEHPEDPEADEVPVTPLFQTQLPDDGASGPKGSSANGRDSRHSGAKSGQGGRSSTSATAPSGSSSTGLSSAMTTDSSGKPVKRKKKKDYIKRNIQLASDAGNTIAMTDDEKKRLEDLLNDMDGLSDIQEEGAEPTLESLHQVAVPRGEGFLPTPDERKKLMDIDYRLQQLMPSEDFESIASASPRVSSSLGSMLFTRTNLSALSAIPEGEVGEEVLRETKDQRHKQERLRHIEEQLDQLTSAVELEMESPSLSEYQLNKLLDECARTMSQATEETSSLIRSSNHSVGGVSVGSLSGGGASVAAAIDRKSDEDRAYDEERGGATERSAANELRRSGSSSLSILYENPPRLPDNVLQQLLNDARKSMSGSAASGPSSPTRREGDIRLESISAASSRSSLGSAFRDSRATSRSSLNSRQQTSLDYSRNSPVSTKQAAIDVDRRPFLPEIDPLGRLSTQKPSQRLNNESALGGTRPNSRTLSNVYTVHNSFSGVTGNQQRQNSPGSDSSASSNDKTPVMSPQPPTSGRQSRHGAT